MPPIKFRIQHLAVDDEGVQIGYYDPECDMKAPGLVKLHTLVVARGMDYDDEIDAVMDAITYLLNDVAEDWDQLPGPTPAQLGRTQEDPE